MIHVLAPHCGRKLCNQEPLGNDEGFVNEITNPNGFHDEVTCPDCLKILDNIQQYYKDQEHAKD